MIDAKAAHDTINYLLEDLNKRDLVATKSQDRIFILTALRGIMGELYRLRKLKEVELRLNHGSGNYTKFYLEEPDE